MHEVVRKALNWIENVKIDFIPITMCKLMQCSDTSLFEFISRRFGEDVAQYAVDPLVRGICAGFIARDFQKLL